MDTLGSLIDKLSIVNIKLYHIQETVSTAAEMGEGLDAQTTMKLMSLNKRRTELINEIDGDKAQEVKVY